LIPSNYFPLRGPKYELRIGAMPIASQADILERDEQYESELALKRECLARDANYYCRALPGSEEAQREVAELAGVAGGIREAGDVVQEDLLILDPAQPGLPLIAGHLCFANAWCLDDKLGRPFMEIHGPVPDFSTTIGPSSEKLLERLKPGRPVSRLNWAVKSTGQLDLTNRWDDAVARWNAEVDSENAGHYCWMRAERQTLSRLERSGAVLFTVHTYTQPVEALTLSQQQILLGVLRTCPGPMLRYKGISPFAAPLIEWLSRRLAVVAHRIIV
jgi:hypothetical protein